MITTVCFDVHGATANAIHAQAEDRLVEFDPAFDMRRWTVTIDVVEEATSASGQVSLWRGEVRAVRHDAPR